jgi:hypothetical protein
MKLKATNDAPNARASTLPLKNFSAQTKDAAMACILIVGFAKEKDQMNIGKPDVRRQKAKKLLQNKQNDIVHLQRV